MDWRKWWQRAACEAINLVIGSTVFKGFIRQFEVSWEEQPFNVTHINSPDDMWFHKKLDRPLTLKLELELWPVGEVYSWDDVQAISPNKTLSLEPTAKPLELEPHKDIVDAEII